MPRTSKNLTYENISSILNHTTNVDFYIFGRSNEGLKPSSRSKFKICSTFSRNLNRLNKFQLDIERKNKGIKVSYQIARLPSIALKPSANCGRVPDMDVNHKERKKKVTLRQKMKEEEGYIHIISYPYYWDNNNRREVLLPFSTTFFSNKTHVVSIFYK